MKFNSIFKMNQLEFLLIQVQNTLLVYFLSRLANLLHTHKIISAQLESIFPSKVGTRLLLITSYT